jgi:hypothetical protein
VLVALLAAGCGTLRAGRGARLTPAETPYLADLLQVTFGGENAEAYWSMDGQPVPRGSFSVPGFSASGGAAGPVVLAGYGIVDSKSGLDDYARLDVKDKIVLVRRFAPEDQKGDAKLWTRLGDLRRKAFVARERGAKALLVVVFFSGEEAGLLGSTNYTRARAPLLRDTVAMLNLDMVGRMRDARLQVLGGDTAAEWPGLVAHACAAERLTCDIGGDGFGVSDQAAFYAAGVPVLHFFTGTHGDYHKPSDTADKINAPGAAHVARVVTRVVLALEEQSKLTLRTGLPGRRQQGDVASNVSTCQGRALIFAGH